MTWDRSNPRDRVARDHRVILPVLMAAIIVAIFGCIIVTLAGA